MPEVIFGAVLSCSFFISYLKQAGACGRRPGQFPRGGGRGCPEITKTILLISVPSNVAKAFGYPFPTVSDRVGLDFGIWIVMLQ